MASSSARAPHTRTALTHRDRALLVAVAAGRCQLTDGPLPSLLIDHRPACDQLAAYQLLANGLIEPAQDTAGTVRARLSVTGEAVIRCCGEAG